MKAELLEFPFVRLVPESMDFWSVTHSGDLVEDARVGRLHAIRLIGRMRLENDPTLLKAVIQSMVEVRRFEGVEIGFCQVLAAELIRSPFADASS